mgnify:CR=1 FL=1
MKNKARKVAVIGLGYVGLPVAVAFSKHGSTVGFDINDSRVKELNEGFDRTGEGFLTEATSNNLLFSTRLEDLKKADFYIVAVPTPIDESKKPDLSALLGASATVGKVLKKDDVVVFESTVYPGATEEDCIPVLEKHSGLKAGVDFHVGYSPERINPGDKNHRFETIKKVVSGQSIQALDIVSETYSSVVTAGIYKAQSIKVAEAAKVIENTQRDLNIALMNELSKIFDLMDIDTRSVLEAAGTKWNFLKFEPGLVGGHCIGVDPYYLTHKAESIGYSPEVILSGRRVNDGMADFISARAVKMLVDSNVKISEAVITVLGVTFKEDVPDLRNSLVSKIIRKLDDYGIKLQIVDPVVDVVEAERRYETELVKLDKVSPSDLVMITVSHKQFVDLGWGISKMLKGGGGSVIDVKGILPKLSKPDSVRLWRP